MERRKLSRYLRFSVALGERGEKPTRELFERFDMHVLR
jgi:hypothetical protein